MSFRQFLLISIIVLLSLLSACRQRPMPMPEHSTWNGTVALPEGTVLPFRFSVDLRTATPTGFFLVGEEQIPIPEISRRDDDLTFRFSEYGADMQGKWDGSRWQGAYHRYRSTGTTSLNFTASPEAAPTNENASLNGAPPVGKYQVSFADEQRSTTLATLWTKGDTLYGTFIAPDGDYGLLVGKPAGGRVQLNRFTGWQAMVIRLEQHDGKWSGQLYTQNEKPRAFVLEPRTDLEFTAPPDLQTRIKDPDAAFAFEGVSILGAAVRNTDERFKGKALLVDIMGTWCHNCLDEAPLLQELQKQYGDKGLEVVGLSFEINDDLELAKKNLKLYQERLGLTYTLLFAGNLDDSNVNNRLRSQLENFFAYPTALFINKEGKVVTIHSGFKGPGTGEEYQLQVAEFHKLAKQLVD